MKIKDYKNLNIGDKIKSFTVIEFINSKDKGMNKKVKVRCECGNEIIVTLNFLLKGKSVNCGCRDIIYPDLDPEGWYDIPKYKGKYKINKNGKIKNLSILKSNVSKSHNSMFIEEHIMTTYESKGEYIGIKIDKHTEYVHHLMAEVFIPNPNNYTEVNHIDHNKKNNSIDNLEWVTHSENMKKYKEFNSINEKKYYCIDCNKIISRNAIRCSECSDRHRRKVERLTREELKNLVRKYSFVYIGKMYNISGKAISKWCKYYNIPFKMTDIRKITDENWKLF